MKVIPFGDNILCRRKKIGEKAGSLYLPDQVQERDTDLAVVVYVPDLTFTDKLIMDNIENIVNSVAKKAIENGDKDAIEALLSFNDFAKRKSIKVGDEIFISKYIGTDFHQTGEKENLTLVNIRDVIGVIVK